MGSARPPDPAVLIPLHAPKVWQQALMRRGSEPAHVPPLPPQGPAADRGGGCRAGHVQADLFRALLAGQPHRPGPGVHGPPVCPTEPPAAGHSPALGAHQRVLPRYRACTSNWYFRWSGTQTPGGPSCWAPTGPGSAPTYTCCCLNSQIFHFSAVLSSLSACLAGLPWHQTISINLYCPGAVTVPQSVPQVISPSGFEQ